MVNANRSRDICHDAIIINDHEDLSILLRYDNLCCTIDCYYLFSLHDVMSFVVIFASPRALGCSVLSIATLPLCITLEFY